MSSTHNEPRNTWGFELGRFVNIPNLILTVLVTFGSSYMWMRDSQKESAFQMREMQRIQEQQARQLDQYITAATQNAKNITELQKDIGFLQRQLDESRKR